jgi:hypothetical protein
MAKITIDPIVGSYASVTALNLRLQQVADAFNDDVLWRDNPVGEVNTMQNDLDMNGYTILNADIELSASTLTVGTFIQGTYDVIDTSTQYYFGGLPAHPTVKPGGAALAEGDSYFNTVTNILYSYDGAGWIYPIPTAASNAVDVNLADAGGNYAALNVEAALAELANTTGAAIIGIADAGGKFTATDVEGALQEVGNRNGCHVYRSTNQAFSSTVGDFLSFDTEVYDDNSFWDVGAPTRLTIPAGVSKVKLHASAIANPGAGAGYWQLSVYKNGATCPGAVSDYSGYVATVNNALHVNTAVLDVTPGDYFEMRIYHNTTGSANVLGGSITNMFEVEVIQ